ncbi:hypothetical protein GO013_03120 [Pseudodesulfovibrio sp. JC047]|uniref:hypothetical protein n=1 Tax=Pseudodesulfovibrio sp. JC047 TaxID=2683199 RepID=UPI0013D41940|nr:hypothetical protein [Pseudodesulfovibrio sp. JC047]NDV18409.1 hypothetical protein [Pseudodesulfovibrio sp. JC047]
MSQDKFIIKKAHIDWECPGTFSFTTGYGATKAENVLANYVIVLAPVLLYFLVWRDLDWSLTQLVVASVLALDMVGGVVTNALGSMKRFLHTEERVARSWLEKLVGSRVLFPFIHFQIFIVPLCFAVTWWYATFWYGCMMLSILFIHRLPLYLRRPVSFLIIVFSIMIGPEICAPPVGMDWFAPIYMLKLVVSHGVREEPYRPEKGE